MFASLERKAMLLEVNGRVHETHTHTQPKLSLACFREYLSNHARHVLQFM